MNEPIPVQPREIVDLVYRIVRVDGLNHGDAALVSEWVTREQIEGRSYLDEVLRDSSALLEQARLADRAGKASASGAAGYAEAAREGVRVTNARFAQLYEAAKSFLVAEATLDEVE